VDFAYAVHSQVGDRTVGAKINGRMAPLRTQLQNGDQVEIVTSRNQTPSPTWERFVVTGKARACIRRFIRTQQRAQYLELGRSILSKDFRHDGHDWSEKALDGALKKLKYDTVDELLVAVGAGNLTGREVIHAVFPGVKSPANATNVTNLADAASGAQKRLRGRKTTGKEGLSVPITGLIPGMAINFAGCCHPLPGDRIVGIVTTGKGVTIHTIDCETLESFA